MRTLLVDDGERPDAEIPALPAIGRSRGPGPPRRHGRRDLDGKDAD
jgi:hypothetical protein